MRSLTRAALASTCTLAAVLGLLAACSGKTSTTQATAGSEGGSGGGPEGGRVGDGASSFAPPANHRPTGVVCALSPTGPEPIIPDAGGGDAGAFTCSTNEQCTMKAGGRCYYDDGACGEPCMARSPSSACLYDECTADTDCKSPFMCTCGQGGGFTNYCTAAGNCRVDSDCASGYCSPTVDGCGTFTGYFCHTAADECYSDDDCVNAGKGLAAKCIVSQANAPWTCQPVGCASAGGAM